MNKNVDNIVLLHLINKSTRFSVNAHIRRLEEEISELKALAITKDADLENTLKRLRTIEEQLSALQIDYDQLRNQHDTIVRETELLKVCN